MFLLDTTAGPGVWGTIQSWDRWLFIRINSTWTNDFLNSVVPWWRDSNTWIPLYLFLTLFAVINFGWRVWPWIVFFVLTASLTDQLSSGLIKGLVQRPRPCNDQDFLFHVNALLGGCSGTFSFPSSHATTHFGMAWFAWLTMKQYFNKWGYLFFFWAATIAYGQVYVGVHYPLDVLGGAVIGSIVGIVTANVFNSKIGLPPLIGYSRSVAPGINE